MKGVSRAIIISLIFLIIVMLFLILAFTIFKEESQKAAETLANLFKQTLRGIK